MKNLSVLLRQIHPLFVQAESVSSQAFSVTSQAFRPTSKDAHKLSVYNGEKFTATESYNHFISNPVCRSYGVMGITQEECEKAGLKCREDNIPFDGHAVIDFTGLSNSQVETKAKQLKSAALKRGWLHSEPVRN